MKKEGSNIHPTFDKILKREDKEALSKQGSIVIWTTGLSVSRKIIITEGLEMELHKRGYLTKL